MTDHGSTCRIISLLSSATEILFGIGLGDCIVGVSHECDYPEAARTRPRVTRSYIDSNRSPAEIDEQVKSTASVGGALYALDADQIAPLRPELIVTQSQCDVCAVSHEEVQQLVARDPRLRSTRVVTLNPTSLDDVLADILRIGTAAGAASAAADYVAGLRSRIARITDRTASISESQRPRTICIEWQEPVMLAGNWTPDLIRRAGGRCALTPPDVHSTYASWESIQRYNPEVIVLSPCGFGLERTVRDAEALKTNAVWNELTAVRSGRVYAVDGNAYLNRSGPRLVDSLEILACLIQPDLFSDLEAHLPERSFVRL